MIYEKKERVVASVGVIVLNGIGEILLSKRNKEPFKGTWVLPSGFMQTGESAEETALREIYEETGLNIMLDRLYGVYSTPNRDPRHHTVSVYYVGHVVGGQIIQTIEASETGFFGINDLPKGDYAFDHKQILKDFKQFPEVKPFKT